MAFQFFDDAAASPSGCSAGVFIPISDLPGISAGEFGAAVSADTKESKATFALCNAIYNNIATGSPLGMAATKGNPAGNDADILSITFTFTNNYYADHENKTHGVIPLATSGANSGLNGRSIDDIFANAVKVAADDEISGEGFVIPTADLLRWGSPSQANINVANDSRDYIQALQQYMVSLTPRSTSKASALTTLPRGATTSLTPPATWYSATDALSNITSAMLNKLSFYSHTNTITTQVQLNQATQSFDVRVVTS